MPKKHLRFSPGCGCCCGCRHSDSAIVLARTDGMDDSNEGQVISILSILENFFQSYSCLWAGATYKTIPLTPFPGYEDGVEVDQEFTTNFAAVETAILAVPYEGGDATGPSGFNALKYVAENWVAIGGRDDPAEHPRIIHWIGDVPSTDGPSPWETKADAITALTAAQIKVIAYSLFSLGHGAAGSDIANATNGEEIELPGAVDEDALLEILCPIYAGDGE
jgi:hypothetical protein